MNKHSINLMEKKWIVLQAAGLGVSAWGWGRHSDRVIPFAFSPDGRARALCRKNCDGQQA